LHYHQFLDKDLKVSSLGIGVEHLKKLSSNEVFEIVKAGLNGGINYIDLVWSLPNVINGVIKALNSNDEPRYIAIHLGSGHKNGKYYRTRKPEECKQYYREIYEKLPEKSIPIINIHYINQLKDWNKNTKPGNILDAAIELKDEGHGAVIAVSTHSAEVVTEAALHPEINSVMFQVNMANHTLKNRDSALKSCLDNNTSIVAMKPYAGGRLLAAGKKTKVAGYMRAGKSVEFISPLTITSHKCLAYTLDQIGVCCALTGPACVEEISDSLKYFDIDDKDKNYDQELSEIGLQIN
jgi:predicted aldo/keto reductase-like oxidoreductase